MSIENNKLMNLADGKVLYDDLRGRVDEKQAKITTSGILKGDGTGNVSAAVEGTDYINGDLIAVQDATPTDPNTQIWLPETQPQSVQVPTYTEHQALLSQINVLQPSATSGDVGKFLKAKTVADGKVTEYEFSSASGGGVSDVQVNGTSVVSQGVANVPVASGSALGVVKVATEDYTGNGIYINTNNVLNIASASGENVKLGTATKKPIVPSTQHQSVFYGLAKCAGNSDQGSSNNSVGVYTEDAKSKINQMFDAPETVSGSTPSIAAKAGVRYICGEVSTLTITVPESGCIDVVFESGSTATVLTVTPTKTGVSAIKWAGSFDPTSLDANTVYEINILDGEFGVMGSWT